MKRTVLSGISWELKQATRLKNIPFILFWGLLIFPYRLEIIITQVAIGKTPRDKSLHVYVSRMCKIFHIPPKIVYRIESTRFQDPYSFEVEVSDVLAETSGQLFVDVGANIGRYTILLAPKYQRVMAIEPEPNNLAALKRSVQEARLENVTFVQCVVSNVNENVELFFGRHPGTHTIMSSAYEHGINVPAKTLDILLSLEESIDLIKVDVEGAEWKVLSGAKEIMGRIRSWLIELHDLERREELKSLMHSFGYECRWLNGKHIYAQRSG